MRANESAGPTRAAIEHVGADRTRATFTSVLDRFVRGDGTVRLDNVFRVVVARA